MRSPKTLSLLFALCAWLQTTALYAQAPSYATQDGFELVLPEDPDNYSFWTSATAFPSASTGFVDGYALAGRILAAHGRKLFLQRTFGQNDYFVVATLDVGMDPSFVRISPDGASVALGVGSGKPLLVFPSAILNAASPPSLSTHPQVMSVTANYYDATFRDARYLFINAGWFTGSAIYVLDTQASPDDALRVLIGDIPGASSGLTFDREGNFITGIGWDPETRTGELRIFPSELIEEALADGLEASYEDDGLLLAHNVLSAASLVVDAEGNLFVGGGDVFGPTGNFGYAALIVSDVLTRVLGGGAPLDPASSEELVTIAPDPCANDDSVTILYIEALEMAIVSANLATLPPSCAETDWSGGGAPSRYVYFPPGAPDDDEDGIPNGMDPDYSPRRFLDRDYFSRFVDLFGATQADAHFEAAFDLNDDGAIGFADLEIVRGNWGAPRWR